MDWRDHVRTSEHIPPCPRCESKETMAVVGKGDARVGCLECGAIWRVSSESLRLDE